LENRDFNSPKISGIVPRKNCDEIIFFK